ncbi:MAG: RusA family crossover junction endodeoxyribonuclease [Halomonas sp.]
MTRLDLPWPPSTNKYWRNPTVRGRGRTLISARGRAYRTEVAACALEQGVRRPYQGPLRLEIAAHPPDRRRRDLDNLLKATLDALAHAGVYLDDEQITALAVRRESIERPGGRLSVTIAPEEAPA